MFNHKNLLDESWFPFVVPFCWTGTATRASIVGGVLWIHLFLEGGGVKVGGVRAPIISLIFLHTISFVILYETYIIFLVK